MSEVAVILRFTDRHIRALIAEAKIKAHRFDTAVRISRADLDDYIDRSQRHGKAT